MKLVSYSDERKANASEPAPADLDTCNSEIEPRSGSVLQPNVAALRGYVGKTVRRPSNREAVASDLATLPLYRFPRTE